MTGHTIKLQASILKPMSELGGYYAYNANDYNVGR